jgi:transcriptional regulator with XRE-family HTH domain
MSLLGDKLREVRQKMNLTMDELARMTGLSKNFIYKIEKGHQDISSGNLLTIAKTLNVSTDYLLTGEEPKPPTYSQIEEFWQVHRHQVLKEEKEEYDVDPRKQRLLELFKELPPETQDRIFKILELWVEEVKERRRI